MQLSLLVGTEAAHNNTDTWTSSPSGNSLIFDTNGSIQGAAANGKADQYESVRGEAGWSTSLQGLSGAESPNGTYIGGASAGHRFAFFTVERPGSGSLLPGNYLRERGGAVTFVGQGSLGVDPDAEAYALTEDGSHVIFGHTTHPNSGVTAPAAPLEPGAPPRPIEAIYDRSAGGPTHVVSLLPGDITPAADARYLGSSADATALVFEINGTIYVRRNGAVTEVAAYSKPGTNLTCSASNLGSATGRQWLRNGVPIAGATTENYIVGPSDTGNAIQCVWTGASTVSASVPPALITTTEAPIAPPQPRAMIPAPTPAAPVAGTTETCTPGEWTGSPAFFYQWYASGKPIAGATSQTYEVQGADVPANIQCEVSATNGDGTVVAFSGATATAPAPAGTTEVPVVDLQGTVKAVGGGTPAIASFAGAANNGGSRVFIARGQGEAGPANPYDSLEVYEAAGHQTTAIAEEGDVWAVLTSEDGSHFYFTSTAVLATNANAFGATANLGEQNLYVWNGSGVKYIASMPTLADVVGHYPGCCDLSWYGLGLWTSGRFPNNGLGPARDPARATADGSILAFQTSANLMPGFNSQGHSEIYRFVAGTEALECVSCNPSSSSATQSSELQTLSPTATPVQLPPAGEFAHIPNLTSNGATVIFETPEALVSADRNTAYDVYQWSSGTLSLISAGAGEENSFLYGMSASGDNIFFNTYDTLVSQDKDGGVSSLYDARINGGFPPAAASATCSGETCQGPLASPPALTGPATPTVKGQGNFHPKHKKKHGKHKKKHTKKKHGKHKKEHGKHVKKTHGKRGGHR